MTAKKILVTGGLGFIGASLSQSLVRAGYCVRIFDNSFRGSLARLADCANDVEVFNGDIRDATLVQQAVEGVDSVCHLAYVNGTRNFYEKPGLVLDVAVKGMMNLLDACIQHSVDDFILASSSEVYQTPPTVPTDETAPLSVPNVLNPRYSYGGGKIICELLALHYKNDCFNRVAIFRPHNVYGPNMGWKHVIPEFVVRMLELKQANRSDKQFDFPIQGTGTQTRAFIYIDDFVDGVMDVIQQGLHREIYHIGTNDERNIQNIAHEIANILGISIEIVPGPEPAGATARRCPDIRKLQTLGFCPQISFEEGLRRTVPWYAANWQMGVTDQIRKGVA